jgi:hypothetical protein
VSLSRSAPDENVSSPVLPGGNLIAAALDRQVMIWSDRGGASRHIGDRWAIRSYIALRDAISSSWPVPHGEPFDLLDVIRLDDVPDVSKEANQHHLENPDFLLVGARGDARRPVLQAADAKFAADRIKPSQVSADVVGNLLALNGATMRLVQAEMERLDLDAPEIARGVFVTPHSTLTDYLLRRVATGRNASVDPQEVVSVPADPGRMFAGLPQARLIGPLARIDELPVTPRTNLISALYYFRLACACFFFWSESNKPLLSQHPPDDPEPGIVAGEVMIRAGTTRSAWELIAGWAADIEPQVKAREAINEVAALPVRMKDIRALIEGAGIENENRVVRMIRRDLELAFRARLFEEVGEIPANDPRPLSRILEDVARASRSLGPEMYQLLQMIAQEALATTIGEPRTAG